MRWLVFLVSAGLVLACCRSVLGDDEDEEKGNHGNAHSGSHADSGHSDHHSGADKSDSHAGKDHSDSHGDSDSSDSDSEHVDNGPPDHAEAIDPDEDHDYADHADDEDDSDEAWHRYEKTFDDSYDDPEEEARHKTEWKKTKHYITKTFPELAKEKGWHFKVGVNKLSDQDDSDIKSKWTGLRQSPGEDDSNGEPLPMPNRRKRETRPHSFDWRKEGGVTIAKNQSPLGSCWAFAAAAALETQYWKQTKELYSVSVEPILTCCKGCYHRKNKNWWEKKHDRQDTSERDRKNPDRPVDPDNHLGSDASYAFDFAFQWGKIQSNYSMPYKASLKAGLSQLCPVSKRNLKQKPAKRTYYRIPKGDEEALMYGIWKYGPATISLHVSDKSFEGYSGGLYTDNSHCSKTVEHAMLVVGYGTMDEGEDKGEDYFVIKNSWGTGKAWGQNGFMLYKRGLCGKDENGIASDALIPKYPYK